MHLGRSLSRYAGGIAGINHFDIHFLQVLTGVGGFHSLVRWFWDWHIMYLLSPPDQTTAARRVS